MNGHGSTVRPRYRNCESSRAMAGKTLSIFVTGSRGVVPIVSQKNAFEFSSIIFFRVRWTRTYLRERLFCECKTKERHIFVRRASDGK